MIFRATEYRKRILQLLAEKPNLRTSHFYEALAPDQIRLLYGRAGGLQAHERKRRANYERQIRRVLFLLTHGEFRKRYVGVTYCPDPARSAAIGRPVGENLYWLTETGREHALAHGFITEKAARHAKTYRTRSRNTTLHSSDITETILAFERWCATNGRRLNHRVTDVAMHLDGKTLVPDALLRISDPSRPAPNTFNFFVEVEDTKQNDYEDGRSGVVRKCMFYLRYFRTAECKARFGFTDFRVLIVVKTARYAESLLKALRELMIRGEFTYTDNRGRPIPTTKPVRIFWVVTEDDLRHRIADSIFSTPTDFDCRRYCLQESV